MDEHLQLRRVASAAGTRISVPGKAVGHPAGVGNEQPVMTADNAGDTIDYPEGGLKAWSVVLGAWCAMFSSMGLLNTLAVLHAWIATNELPDISESTNGWIFSTYAFFLYFCGVQTGV